MSEFNIGYVKFDGYNGNYHTFDYSYLSKYAKNDFQYLMSCNGFMTEC